MTADTEVLGREIIETILRWGPPCVVFGPASNKGIILYEDDHDRLLRHDAALRARIEALEAEREVDTEIGRLIRENMTAEALHELANHLRWHSDAPEDAVAALQAAGDLIARQALEES